MKTELNNNKIIQVHFNNDRLATEANYATYINGKFVVLVDESGIDMNDIEDIKELSHDGVRYESTEEHVHPYYYEIKNGDFPTPFSDNDIPEHFFKLGIL